MDVNATLIVQVATFVTLVWLMKRLLWAPMMRLTEQRHRRLAQGAEAAEHGCRALEAAEVRAQEVRAAARAEAQRVIARAERLSREVADAVKAQTRAEVGRLIESARAEIAREAERARGELDVATDRLAVMAAARVLAPASDTVPRPH
jgi:F-type H+-transporting ATPase subunit b